MSFNDIEVGLNETNDLRSARYFALHPGRTRPGKFYVREGDIEELPRSSLTFGEVLEFLMRNSVEFQYDKTLYDADTDLGVRLSSRGTIHFYKRSNIFYFGAAFLKAI